MAGPLHRPVEPAHVNAVRSPQGRHAFSGQYLCIGSLAAVVLVTAAAAATSYSPVIAAMMAAIAAAVGIGAAILVLRSWQLRCDVSSDSLTVRNPLRSISFRWEDISGVTVESAGPLGPKSAGAIRCLSFGLPDGRVKAVATNNLDLRLAPSIRLVTELHRHQVPVDWEAISSMMLEIQRAIHLPDGTRIEIVKSGSSRRRWLVQRVEQNGPPLVLDGPASLDAARMTAASHVAIGLSRAQVADAP